LDDVIPIEVFDENYNMQAKRNDDRMDLGVVSMISLLLSCKFEQNILVIA